VRVSYLAVLPLLSLSAQQYPNAVSLLEQNKRAYTTLRSYQYVAESVIDMTVDSHPTKVESTVSVAALNPDKFRKEMKSQALPVTIVVDGEHTWIYQQARKKYMKKDAIWIVQGLTSGLRADSFTGKQTLARAKVIGEETPEVDGAAHDCWVVETKLDKAPLVKQFSMEMRDVTYTLWIDKKSAIDLQTTMSGKMQGRRCR